MMTKDEFELVLRNVVNDAVKEIKADNALVRDEVRRLSHRVGVVEERVTALEDRVPDTERPLAGE